MLRLIGIGEFSDLAVWTESTGGFVLNEVICKACNHCRDLDLVKDKDKALKDGMYEHININIDRSSLDNSILFNVVPFGCALNALFTTTTKKSKYVCWTLFNGKSCRTRFRIFDVYDVNKSNVKISQNCAVVRVNLKR